MNRPLGTTEESHMKNMKNFLSLADLHFMVNYGNIYKKKKGQKVTKR
jgi:hypothetical protein